MVGFGVAEQIGTFDHPGDGLQRRRIQWDDAVARLVLAAADVKQLLRQVDVAAAEVLDLHRPHRCVSGSDRRTVDVLPLRIGCRSLEEPLALVGCQRPADRTLTFGQVAHVVRQRTPSAARLEDARQHADIHIDGPVGLARVMALALVVGNSLRGDSGQRHVAEVTLQGDQPLFLELDRAGRAVQALAVDVGVHGLEQPLRSLRMRRDGAVAGVLDELPLLALGVLQVRRVEPLAVATAIDREVRPVLTPALP
ncbi:MAG: hypothetical protein ABS36_11590 [Acidobacteria bacterium SCN 69-37]|nr:MAG: hypothetical protein ABS36_11590 [Acidobacteria bacterium SCN 69-37]